MPLALPHSQFLSWPEIDQDKALALREVQQVEEAEAQIAAAKLCPSCGTDPDEWLDERGRPIDPPPFAIEDRRCLGCVELAELRKDEDFQKNAEGVHLRLVRNVDEEDE